MLPHLCRNLNEPKNNRAKIGSVGAAESGGQKAFPERRWDNEHANSRSSLARSKGSFSCDILKNIKIFGPHTLGHKLHQFPCTFVNKILPTQRPTDTTQMSYVKAPQSFFFRLQNLSLPFRNQESKERVELRVFWKSSNAGLLGLRFKFRALSWKITNSGMFFAAVPL